MQLVKVGVQRPVAFRWGSPMPAKRIARPFCGGTKAPQGFPMPARACLEGRAKPGKMVAAQFPLDVIDHGAAAPERGESVGSKVIIP